MFKRITKRLNKLKVFIICAIGTAMMPVPAFASGSQDGGVSEMTQAINRFGDIFAAIISAVGGVVLIWQIVNLALAIKRRDPAATSEALIGVGAGLLLVFAPQVVKYILA